MEEKVMEQEARSQASAELGQADLEQQFSQLESGSDVDDELSMMKAQMTGSQSAGELPEGEEQQSSQQQSQQKSKPDDSVVDSELEELRRQLDNQ
jgi:phage shock protein A